MLINANPASHQASVGSPERYNPKDATPNSINLNTSKVF